MAADEVLLHAAFQNQASLRFYGWSGPTLSLGYFQSAHVRLNDPLRVTLPWVRRASGGSALIHQHELTYALALPPGPHWQPPGSWLRRMHAVIKGGLENLGLCGKLTIAGREPEPTGESLCFGQHTPGDLLCEGIKVVGSAQRKGRQCLLQHGAILMKRSPFAPQLPGIEDLCGVTLKLQDIVDACVAELSEETGWSLQHYEWNPEERQTTLALKEQKYATPQWNEKR
ncbi:MAG: lipoate--protein ligase family protein [Planctomycetes bacterium]|nr:lipoate--protein ligase family protein [Planctomycetota bacterium]